MSTIKAIQWFKQTFYKELTESVKDTPFSADQLCAIAYQETGYIWAGIRESHSHDEIFKLCTGDTIDAPGRSAFPKTRKDLESWTGGTQMFQVARQALVDVGSVRKEFANIAKKYPSKFCHGFGIFQYDIQFFKKDPQWFLQRKWTSFAECRAHVIKELKEALKRQGWQSKTVLTDTEKVHVCIAYNRGKSDLAKGFRQGHYNKEEKRYYGEYIHEYLTIAKNIPAPSPANPVPAPSPHVILPPPTSVEPSGNLYQVDVSAGSSLNVRRTPEIPQLKPESNIVVKLPGSHVVKHLGGKKSADFWEIETSLNGAYIRGFASPKYLKSAPSLEIEVLQPASEEPKTGVIAAHLTPKQGTVIARVNIAGAYSLNEKNMPVRAGDTAQKRCSELANIITWLNSENSAHKRYWPRDGLTFCNIYAHDYCGRAGVYLPRVWWTGPALIRLAKGETVEPAYGKTVDEVRANDLFRWLRDFGPLFGWRQTGTLTKLQEAANLGAVGLIVARRVQEGRSGHIVAVVPETDVQRAKRNTEGNVTHPLQSQAGARNFRYSTSTTNWWLGSQFAESAFWIHA
ncbi:hypothetical protein SAMN02745166_01028 [Prosthecobacter debontii]|uniref:SH3 domain-containing protein n=1 Tax=Prosthecobacter debontii TaxID=48467 RepID=A0A1T4X4S7_9BACT|nr:hypothetical protein [Prosthecobacter debontii]SKA84546.1 hypothetical protein SAMN02745166_01028 [Prosthecobacter debontii]